MQQRHNNLPPIHGALFDLDGVLVDSEGEYTLFWDAVGRRYGKPSTYANDIKGTTLTQIIQGFPEADRQGIVDELHSYESRMHYPVYPGVMQFLASLRSHGIPSAIVTSSDDSKMEVLARKHSDLLAMVDYIITADMVGHGKPDPECYLKGAAKIGIPPGECYVFEDSLQGLQAGRDSGAVVVGLTTTNPLDKVAPLSDIVLGSMARAMDSIAL